MIRQLLGKSIADRYVDVCRLASGALPLRVSIPVAAHALRELESILRQMTERVRTTRYDVVRAQGGSDKDAEAIRAAFVYEGFSR